MAMNKTNILFIFTLLVTFVTLTMADSACDNCKEACHINPTDNISSCLNKCEKTFTGCSSSSAMEFQPSFVPILLLPLNFFVVNYI